MSTVRLPAGSLALNLPEISYNLPMAVPKPDPKRLALQAVAGAVVAAGAFLVPLLPFAHERTTGIRLWPFLLALLVPMAIGGIIWYSAHRRLSCGYQDNLWNEAELAPVRSLMAHEYWTWMSVGLFGAAVAVLAFTRHGGAFIYLTTLPMNAVGSIRRLLTPPVERAGLLINSRDLKPLHSDHWGESGNGRNTPLPS